MATEQDYRVLVERLSKLGQKQAVLQAREEDKRAERARLTAELIEAGINLDDLEGEVIRLTVELEAHYNDAKRQVEQFEFELNEAVLKNKELETK